VLLALTVGPPVWAYFAKGSLIRIFWFIPSGVGLVLLTGLLQYTKGSPICPQCHEDVTSCFAAHCQACGEKLARGRCARCGLDTTLAAGFSTGLIRQHIRHCPGCGVFLNTNFYRDEFLGG
jgi:hypothetical protein